MASGGEGTFVRRHVNYQLEMLQGDNEGADRLFEQFQNSNLRIKMRQDFLISIPTSSLNVPFSFLQRKLMIVEKMERMPVYQLVLSDSLSALISLAPDFPFSLERARDGSTNRVVPFDSTVG